MKLSEMKFEDIKVGQRVQSLHSGAVGTVVKLIPREQACRKEDNEIAIDWDNGKESQSWHFWLDKVITL